MIFEIADEGFEDEYRGWYDIRGCGSCNDYCRWVGDGGSGGNPALKTFHARGTFSDKERSYWACQTPLLTTMDFSFAPKFLYRKCNE